jgi:endonuclease/exonuclease/phosphatase family metal-dependent hydrolase
MIQTQARSIRALLGAFAASALALGACSAGSTRVDYPAARDATKTGLAASSVAFVTLDGDVSDWSDGVMAWADQHHLYVRFTIEGELYTPQSGDRTTAILLDVDANPATGRRPESEGPFSNLGVDLEVRMAPKQDDGSPGRGAVVIGYDASGAATTLETHDWDFSFAPTYASTWYEARVTRTPGGSVPFDRSGLLSQGAIAGAVVAYDAGGSIELTSDIFRVEGVPGCMEHARRSTLRVPAKAPGAVRVVSYNVLRSAPDAKPEVFSRIFRALDPDVVLVQEWEVQEAQRLVDWFTQHAPQGAPWHAACLPGKVMEGAGVGIIARSPVTLVTDPLLLDDARNTQVRFVGAGITTPVGPMLAASVHLKAAGSMGSSEDQRRIREAELIRAVMADRYSSSQEAMIVIGGDYNLVGSRTPLERLIEGIDADATNLGVANPQTVGDRTFATWSEAGNRFSPGRLDFIAYGDANARVSRAFVLDTSRLSDESLQEAGLLVGDTAEASDHLPVVVDLVPTSASR